MTWYDLRPGSKTWFERQSLWSAKLQLAAVNRSTWEVIKQILAEKSVNNAWKQLKERTVPKIIWWFRLRSCRQTSGWRRMDVRDKTEICGADFGEEAMSCSECVNQASGRQYIRDGWRWHCYMVWSQESSFWCHSQASSLRGGCEESANFMAPIRARKLVGYAIKAQLIFKHRVVNNPARINLVTLCNHRPIYT